MDDEVFDVGAGGDIQGLAVFGSVDALLQRVVGSCQRRSGLPTRRQGAEDDRQASQDKNS